MITLVSLSGVSLTLEWAIAERLLPALVLEGWLRACGHSRINYS